MLDINKISKKMICIRKENNMTQDDVAEKLFISRQLVSKWENGNALPSIDMLLNLCDLYHTTFNVILCLDDED